MKQLARPVPLPPLLVALERRIATLDRDVPSALWRRALSGPAAEFLARPGKELRGAIVRACWLLAGGDPAGPHDRIARVIELLHAGSLVVDDVEDGAIERRGAPALHQLVGAPLAINTGCWMYFWALSELAALELPPAAHLAAYRATIATLARCHEGQALDLAAHIGELDIVEVRRVVAATTRLKTGALCRLAAELAALAAGVAPAQRDAIGAFGEDVGIALQMLDDLGSIASPARRAKGREDLAGGRPTWPWAWLAEASPFAWLRLAARARDVVDGTGDADALADALAAETHAIGRAEARALLDGALARLAAAVGAGPQLDRLADELARLERSYA